LPHALPSRFRRTLTILALSSGAAAGLGAQNGGSDQEAVRRASMDYIEAFYEGDSVKFLRSVRPEFYKYGFYKPRDAAAYAGSQMTLEGALGYIRRVRDGKNFAPTSAPKEVQVYEVNDQTANVKITASWGIDYLLMSKYDGRWMISHVLWQSHPPKK
jgi:hypothetical protein